MVQAAKSSSTVTGYSCSVHGQTNKHEETKREKKCSVRWLAFSISCFNMSTRAFETLGRVSEDGHFVRFGSRFAKFVQEAALLLARSRLLAVSGVAMPFDSFARVSKSSFSWSLPTRHAWYLEIQPPNNIMHNAIIGVNSPYT
ncbi:hypothetical protein NCS56_01161100 [Fusarium sp. Ph1]|nr:hypothetical protein NCS56_01161100 [Fusarium sp. Ph1]